MESILGNGADNIRCDMFPNSTDSSICVGEQDVVPPSEYNSLDTFSTI